MVPVRTANETQTADTVCNGNLIRGGGSARRLGQLRGGHSLLEQFMLDPGLNERHGRPLCLKSRIKLLHKRCRQWHIRFGKLGQ